MDNMLHLSASPHIHSGKSTAAIMRDVLIALVPATVAGVVIFGVWSLLIIGVCVGCCVGFEALFNKIMKKDQTIGDLSAAVTGLLLALNLPNNIPALQEEKGATAAVILTVVQCVIGSAFAILLVKCLFGGIGFNLVNPAISARVFMLVAFGSVARAGVPEIVDTVSSATPLVQLSKDTLPDLKSLLLGTTGGAIGETCAIALLLGFAYLLIRRVISWHIPTAYIGSVFLLSLCMEGFDPIVALSYVLSGGLLIGAIFMATDYVTSPPTPLGKLVFGLGCGILTFLIRYFGTYPEGVSFAILFMNILTPYIVKLTAHKVFGGVKA